MSYCRVYHSIIDDEKFADVYHDDKRLALWLRLLIGADQAYPSPAVLPRSANGAALRHLVAVRLVELVGPDHYRVIGMQSERTSRSNAGRIGAALRWHSDRNALPYSKPMLAEPSQAKPSQNVAKRRCPKDPTHDLLATNGKVMCMACGTAIA